ncbi:MAG: transglycosylase SLT domain-containing protein [Saprospiraceae bacterium]|nr:transglycosylase SLT domain-containing protein [Lewinella sp.]
MKLPWTLTVLAGFCLLANIALANANSSLTTSTPTGGSIPLTNEVLQERIEKIDLPFTVRITPAVREYIKRYTENGYKDAELILGRSAMYFSIFEHYLSVYQLPRSLKYLPIVESALRADVRSSAGAAGLWQFVPVSANYFKLEMNGVVDERLDPYRSTEAAVKMLAFLYDEFKDWPLALAAYNCGHGRVKQAIKRARCNNYWEIQQFLPYATRKYVPAFVAAAYLGNYYQEHGLNPRFPDHDLQDTRVFRIYENISFYKLSSSLNIPLSTLTELNPSYVKKYIPYNRKGYLLRVPSVYASAVRKYLDEKLELKPQSPEAYFETFYVVTPGDRIETLASLFQCTTEELMAWNGLYQSDIVAHQHLRIYLPKSNKIIRP